jgi:hypothetical protein
MKMIFGFFADDLPADRPKVLEHPGITIDEVAKPTAFRKSRRFIISSFHFSFFLSSFILSRSRGDIVLFSNVSLEVIKLYGAIWFSGHVEPNALPVAHPHSLFRPAFMKFPIEVISLRPRDGARLFREKPTEFLAIENSLLCISPFQNLKYLAECVA